MAQCTYSFHFSHFSWSRQFLRYFRPIRKGTRKPSLCKEIENLNGLSLLCDVLQIKVLEPSSQKISTLAGTGTAGFKDGVAKAAQVLYLLFTFSSTYKDTECVICTSLHEPYFVLLLSMAMWFSKIRCCPGKDFHRYVHCLGLCTGKQHLIPIRSFRENKKNLLKIIISLSLCRHHRNLLAFTDC